jgi:hypothetical protein
MNNYVIARAALLLPLLLLASQVGHAGEKFGRPPVESALDNPPLTESAAGDAILVKLQKQFDAAADPSTHLLTKDGALKIGWGWAADHFSEMDTQHKGVIRFEEVSRYVRHRTTIRLP